MRPGRRHQRRLVDGLIVELGVDRRLAGEHHHRQAGANRGRQRRHQLGHARAARDGGNGDLVGGDVVGCRRRDGDVLVPDVDGMHARQFGKGGGPVHVAVAHQDELRVDSLRKERFCEGFVEFGHGRGTLGWRPADGTLAAVAAIGIRHFPLAAPRKRYIRPARRRKGASSLFFLLHKSPFVAHRSCRDSAAFRLLSGRSRLSASCARLAGQRFSAEAARASAVTRAKSPAATASAGATQEPPTAITLRSAR